MKPEFLFCEAKEMPGAGLILRTIVPYEIAKVYRFETDQQMQVFLDKHGLNGACGKVPGYRILICIMGTLYNFEKNPIPLSIKSLFNSMIEFYEREKIIGNESRLKRYKEA